MWQNNFTCKFLQGIDSAINEPEPGRTFGNSSPLPENRRSYKKSEKFPIISGGKVDCVEIPKTRNQMCLIVRMDLLYSLFDPLARVFKVN